MASGAPDWWIQGIIPMTFLSIFDTPAEYDDHAGQVPKVNAGEDALEFSDAVIDAHKSRHVVGGADALAHTDLNPQPADHHAVFTAAHARASINDIFGSDGKADADINLDGKQLKDSYMRLGHLKGDSQNFFTNNLYYDAPNWKYITNGFGSYIRFERSNGAVYIYTAVSGVADAIASMVVRFKLDVNGYLDYVRRFDGVWLSKPVSVGPHIFVPASEGYAWFRNNTSLNNRASDSQQLFYGSVQLPHGKTVSKLDLYGYRTDVDSTLAIELRRNNRANTSVLMATCTSNWTDGWGTIADSSITSATIDNDNYSYDIKLEIFTKDNPGDVYFSGARISFS